MTNRLRPCCVPGCNDKTLPRFIIPQDANIRQIWIQRICNVKLSSSSDTYLKNNHPVCKSHFADCCIEDSGRLRKHSLPTLNLPGYNKWLTEVNCFFYPKNDDSYINPEKVRAFEITWEGLQENKENSTHSCFTARSTWFFDCWYIRMCHHRIIYDIDQDQTQSLGVSVLPKTYSAHCREM